MPAPAHPASPPILPLHAPRSGQRWCGALIAGLLGLAAPLAPVHAQDDPAATPPVPTAPATARRGEHRITLPDGGRYQGPLRAGRLHGEGRIDWDGGRRYVGQFVDGYMEGQGRYTEAGVTYVGQFHRGNFQGKGRLERQGSYRYEGDFVQGRMQGHGKLQYEGGYSFEGQFKNDEPEGKGRATDARGNVIEGTFRQMEPVGPVVMTAADGSRYEGPVMARMPHGQGVLTRPDKAVLRGRFEVGSLTGPATIDYPNGARYSGAVDDAQAQGQGTLRQADGATYVGQFRQDQPDGKGQLTRADSSVQTGYWRAGRYIGTVGDDTLDDTPQLAAQNNQRVLYNQAALLQKQFDALQPSPAGAAPQAYALYIAGDGRQEVFRREVTYVDALMAQRFGTRGRSVSLVNSRSSADRLPLATPHSIGLALQALAQKMDRQRDLLFVYLTSHGSPMHELSLAMPRMMLPDLPAAQLGELLKASGIRNQIVVVSACYSGGFVPALRGERTWVITAARADRTSFGCADDNEFTYFGRALFKESLGQAPTLSDAFAQTREKVEAWEARDGAVKPDVAAASAKAPKAVTTPRRVARRDAPKIEHSEPMSVVAPAFQAEVDAWVRQHAPVTLPDNAGAVAATAR